MTESELVLFDIFCELNSVGNCLACLNHVIVGKESINLFEGNPISPINLYYLLSIVTVFRQDPRCCSAPSTTKQRANRSIVVQGFGDLAIFGGTTIWK